MTWGGKMSCAYQHPLFSFWHQDIVNLASKKWIREVKHRGDIQGWASRKPVTTESKEETGRQGVRDRSH